jgi:hypothetical protein
MLPASYPSRCARKARAAAICLLAISTGLGALNSWAQNIPVPRYEDEEQKEKLMSPVPLPAFPKKENLVRFPTSWTSNEVYIDTSSFVFGDDEVLSYALLVRGSGGAENYTFESLRCTSGERRVLAYGRNNGTWSPARNVNWQRIVDSGINRHYFEFYRDVFCTGKTVERREDILRNIRGGGRERYVSPASE